MRWADAEDYWRSIYHKKCTTYSFLPPLHRSGIMRSIFAFTSSFLLHSHRVPVPPPLLSSLTFYNSLPTLSPKSLFVKQLNRIYHPALTPWKTRPSPSPPPPPRDSLLAALALKTVSIATRFVFVLWEVVTIASKNDIKNVGFIAHKNISNDFTQAIINRAVRDRKDDVIVFEHNAEAFGTLLGTRDGARGADLLVRHKRRLGQVTVLQNQELGRWMRARERGRGGETGSWTRISRASGVRMGEGTRFIDDELYMVLSGSIGLDG